jgi:hypothetical protein
VSWLELFCQVDRVEAPTEDNRSISSLLQGRQPRFTSANVTALFWLAIILSGAYGDHSQVVGVGAIDSFIQRVDTFAQEH